MKTSLPLATGNSSADLLGRAADEFTAALERGERPSIEDFADRYPQVAEVIRQVFPALELMPALPTDSVFGPDSATVQVGDHSGRTLGDFCLIRELGRGGMGVVYEAEQLSIGRRVALKVLPFAAIADPKVLQRFRNEIRAVGTLDHPNIVGIYSVGEERGVHYYAMQLVRGQSLAELIAGLSRRTEDHGQDPEFSRRIPSGQTPSRHDSQVQDAADEIRGEEDASGSPVVRIPNSLLEAQSDVRQLEFETDTGTIAALTTDYVTDPQRYFRRVAELGMQAAAAIEHAHSQGIVHRDIKPANLLLDTHGKLYVTDFGLARIGAEASLTTSGHLLGTLRYMSPEQAGGRSTMVDHRSDIYSLGATLCELATGQPAVRSTDRASIVREIAEREPVAPHKVNPSILVDLETILLKAMSKEPTARYDSARELAEDLERFVQNRPIKARPVGRIARTWRWCRRSPAFAGLVAAVCLLSLCVAGTAMMFAHHENKHRQQAEARTEQAEWQQYLSDMHSAMAAWEQSNVGRTLELLERHRPKQGELDLRGFEWHYLLRQCQDKRLVLTINETSFVRGLSFSHDNQMLATGNAEGLVRIWNATNGWLIHEFKGHQANVRHVAFSPDDRLLASADSDGKIHLRELEEPHTLRTFTGQTGQIHGLVFSADGKQLASGCDDSTIRIWDVVGGRELRVIRPQLRGPAQTHIQAPWTENRLWDFGWDGVLRLFDTETGAELQSIQRPELSLVRSTARVSWDGRMAATAGRDGIIRLLETETGHDLGSLGGHGAAVRSLAFAQDDQTLASSDVYGKVILWDIAKRTPRAVLKGHSGPVWPIEFSNDGQLLCTSGVDHTLRIWNVSGQPSATDICTGHNGLALCVAFSPDGRMIASGGSENGGGTVISWDVATGQLIHQFRGHTGWVWSVAFSPDGKELASTGSDGTVRLWDLTQQRLRATIDTAKEYKSWVSYSLDGRQLITSETHGTLRVWDRSTGAEIRSTHIGESLAEKPALSPDGSYVVAGLDGSIVLLEFPSLKTVRRFPRSPVYGDTIAFSPDGRMIATCDEFSNHVYLSSLDGTPVGTLDHAADVLSVDFSPDGRSLITGDTNHEVHVWDVARCQKRATLRGHDAFVDAVRFSPDGKTIASSGDDGTVRLWRSVPPD